MLKVLVINGPNLNMLGKRPKEIYGTQTLEDIIEELNKYALDKLDLSFYQSNYEGDIVTRIQEAVGAYDAIVINPAAYTHTSVAIRDALEIFQGIIIEVHLSDINQREEFRKIDYIKHVADITFMGEGLNSYKKALEYIIKCEDKISINVVE